MIPVEWITTTLLLARSLSGKKKKISREIEEASLGLVWL